MRTLRCCLLSLLAGPSAVGAKHVLDDRPFCVRELPGRIESILGQRVARTALWGVQIHSALRGVLYEQNPTKSFVPASNMKLVTASAALLHLGEGHCFRTMAVATSRPEDESASACILPGRDPSLNSTGLVWLVRDFLAAWPPPRNGTVTLSVPDDVNAPPASWENGDLEYEYGSQPNAALVNGNVVKLNIDAGQQEGDALTVSTESAVDAVALDHVDMRGNTGTGPPLTVQHVVDVDGILRLRVDGSLPPNGTIKLTRAIRPPMALFLAHLRTAIRTVWSGLANTRLLPHGTACASTTPIAQIASAPVLELLNHTLLQSDNLYAEMHLRELGRGDAVAGLAIARASLEELGLSDTELEGFAQVDGSGLSRHNVVSPSALVGLLRAMDGKSRLRDLLPVGGRSGTLRSRFKGTPAEGRVSAKTGTMSGVSALSGYLVHENASTFGTVTFSLLSNGAVGSGAALRPFQDAIIVQTALARVCANHDVP